MKSGVCAQEKNVGSDRADLATWETSCHVRPALHEAALSSKESRVFWCTAVMQNV